MACHPAAVAWAACTKRLRKSSVNLAETPAGNGGRFAIPSCQANSTSIVKIKKSVANPVQSFTFTLTILKWGGGLRHPLPVEIPVPPPFPTPRAVSAMRGTLRGGSGPEMIEAVG